MVASVVNCTIIPIKQNTNPVFPQGLKLYLPKTKGIDTDSDKLDISVSDSKEIIYHFISIANKYGWGHLALMVETVVGSNTIFRQINKIQISDIHYQAHKSFGLMVIGNVGNNLLPNPLVVELFQLQMGLSFSFLRANYLRLSLLNIRARSFLISCTQGYIRKVSVQLIQIFFSARLQY